MPLHVVSIGFQLVCDVAEAVGKMRLDCGDAPELGCGHPIKRCGVPQSPQNIGISYHAN